MGRASKRKPGGGKKKKGVAGGGRFQEVKVRYKIKIHSSFEIKDLVDTDLCKMLCDPPVARINDICRGLLYARCWV